MQRPIASTDSHAIDHPISIKRLKLLSIDSDPPKDTPPSNLSISSTPHSHSDLISSLLCDDDARRSLKQIEARFVKAHRFEYLPTEIWTNIFKYTNVSTLLRLSQVCVALNRVTADEYVWRKQCEIAGMDRDALECISNPVEGFCGKISSIASPPMTPTHLSFTPDIFHEAHHPNKVISQSRLLKSVFKQAHKLYVTIRRNWFSGKPNYKRLDHAHAHYITCIQSDPTTGTIITGSADKSFKIWKLITTEPSIPQPQPPDPSPPYSPLNNITYDGTDPIDVFGAPSATNNPRINSSHNVTADLQLIGIFDAHQGPITCISCKSTYLVTSSRDTPSLIVWDMPTQKRIHNLQIPHSTIHDPQWNVTCLDHNTWFVMAGSREVVRIWGVRSGAYVGEVYRPRMHVVSIQWPSSSPHPSQTDTTVFTVCSSGVISVWDATDATRCVEVQRVSTVGGVVSARVDVKIAKEFMWEWIVSCGFKDGNSRRWKIKMYRHPQTSSAIKPHEINVEEMCTLSCLSDWISCLSADLFSDVVVAGGWDCRLRIWDSKRGVLQRTLQTDSASAILCLAVVGQTLITGNYDGSLTLWDFGDA